MIKLVLLRHGQSTWNKENKFTGWTDVPLSEQGVQEAHEAGKVLKREGYSFDICFDSFLKRFLFLEITFFISVSEIREIFVNDKIGLT